MTHTDLIARLQSATEGSAELDADVLRACGWVPSRGDEAIWHPVGKPEEWELIEVLCHTRSIDAITALIEAEGWEWFKMVGHRRDDGSALEPDVYLVGRYGSLRRAHHQSAPLALCIAYLRAKEAANG